MNTSNYLFRICFRKYLENTEANKTITELQIQTIDTCFKRLMNSYFVLQPYIFNGLNETLLQETENEEDEESGENEDAGNEEDDE